MRYCSWRFWPLVCRTARGQDTAADLKTLDAKLTEAFKARDFQMLGKHMDEDYMMVDPRGGIHNKKQYLKHFNDGTAKFEELKETDVKVEGLWRTRRRHRPASRQGQGGRQERHCRIPLDPRLQQEGRQWHCVLEQHTHVMPKEMKKK